VAAVVRNGFSRYTGPAGFSAGPAGFFLAAGRPACRLFLGGRPAFLAASLQAFLGGLEAFSWRLLTQAGPGRLGTLVQCVEINRVRIEILN